MTEDEKFKREWLVSELKSLNGYGSSRIMYRDPVKRPASVTAAEKLVARFDAAADKRQKAWQRKHDAEIAAIRKAIAFGKLDQADKLIEAMKRRAG